MAATSKTYLSPHNVCVEPGPKPGTWRASAVVEGQLVERIFAARTMREAADRLCRIVNKGVGGSPQG